MGETEQNKNKVAGVLQRAQCNSKNISNRSTMDMVGQKSKKNKQGKIDKGNKMGMDGKKVEK